MIFLLSDQPVFRSFLFRHSDKLLHALAFGGLAYLLAWGVVRACPGWSLFRVLLVAVLVTVAYGGLDEFHQSFVPRREPDLLDLLADGVGALGAVLVFRWIWSKGPGVAPAPD